jgi:hypothetical protein
MFIKKSQRIKCKIKRRKEKKKTQILYFTKFEAIVHKMWKNKRACKQLYENKRNIKTTKCKTKNHAHVLLKLETHC